MWKNYKVIDADGHMHEPQYLWERYVEPKFRVQVPKVAFMDGNFMVYEHVIGSDSFRLQKSTQLLSRFCSTSCPMALYVSVISPFTPTGGPLAHSSITCNVGVVSRRHFMK